MTVLPLRRITDLTRQETLLGHVLGYGAFRFRSAGQDPARRHLTFVPNAAELYRDVSELLSSTDYAAGGGDETGDEERQPPATSFCTIRSPRASRSWRSRARSADSAAWPGSNR